MFPRDTTSTSWSRNLDSIHFLETLHTIWQICLHQKCWTTTNRSSLPSEYRQIVRSSICLTFIGFRRCTKIHINIDSLRVHRSVRPSLYQFYSKNCLHIFSKVFRSTARQPTQGVGSIRCGSSRIRKNYNILIYYQTPITWLRYLSAILPLFWRHNIANIPSFAAKTWEGLLWRHKIHDVFPRNWANSVQILKFFYHFSMKFNNFFLNSTGGSDILILSISSQNKLSMGGF